MRHDSPVATSMSSRCAKIKSWKDSMLKVIAYVKGEVPSKTKNQTRESKAAEGDLNSKNVPQPGIPRPSPLGDLSAQVFN